MTDDPTEAFEHSEHADHAAHSGNRFVALVALSIAVLAAVAAASGSLESIETEAATSFRSTAVLLQNKATDNFVQFFVSLGHGFFNRACRLCQLANLRDALGLAQDGHVAAWWAAAPEAS